MRYNKRGILIILKIMKKLLILIAAVLVVGVFASAWDISRKYEGPKIAVYSTAWHSDILPGYEARYVRQQKAFDGPCRSTIVRRLADQPSHSAYLYIHGFNDYFFQSEMGELLCDSGYNFYAVDLRRYGRSKLPWQYPYDVRNLDEYFADIDSAVAQIRRDGNTDITLSGHSTGGLTVSLYAAMKGDKVPVHRVVTDSPFLEWNYNAVMRNVGAPLVGFLGKMFPESKIKQDSCNGYAESLLKEFHGQWTYNTDWKMIFSPPVTFGWVGAINSGQSRLMRNAGRIAIPVLVMHSSRKIDGCGWNPAFQTGDCVLNPHMIQERGLKLGKNPTVCAIDSGIHDLILSEPRPRRAAYDTIFRFLRHTVR